MCGGGGGGKLLGALALGALAIATGGFGLAAGGALEGAGAVAGSEAFATGVGAAGGDAIGSLIASNAANWGMTVAPEIAALGGSAAELAALAGPSAGTAIGGTGTQVAAAPAGEAAAGTGADFMGALKAGAQLAPLATLALAAGANPKLDAQLPTPSAAPGSQAAQTPAPNIFKKKLSGLGDPTQTSGVGGVADLSLGKATVLGQ